jgi:hypothetical protein
MQSVLGVTVQWLITCAYFSFTLPFFGKGLPQLSRTVQRVSQLAKELANGLCTIASAHHAQFSMKV